MKLTLNKHFYILFVIISVLFAGLLYYLLQTTNYPFNLIPDDLSLVKSDDRDVVKDIEVDLDNDGLTEKLRLVENNYIQLFNSKVAILEQLNFHSITKPSWIYFEDYNNDSNKELFIFSQLKDSLFFSVYNYHRMEYILNREKILTKPDSAKKGVWDVKIFPIGLNENNKNKIIFAVSTGFPIYPRATFLYDFVKKEMIKDFQTSATLKYFNFFDFNNDGRKEIVLTSEATGNIKEKVDFHDRTKWLFVFDQNLDPIITPLHFGQYPSKSFSLPIKNKNGYYDILYFHEESDSTGRKRKWKIIDLKGNVDSTRSILKNFPDYSTLPITHNDNFFLLSPNNTLIKINPITGETLTNYIEDITYTDLRSYRFIKYITTLDENIDIFIVQSENKLFLIDENLNILAKHITNDTFSSRNNWITLRVSKKENLPQINMLTDIGNVLFTIKRNKIYTYLPYIAFLSFLLFFFLQVLFHNLLMLVSTYIKYLSHSINKTERGIAIFKNNKSVFYKNDNFLKYLNLGNKNIKNLNYAKILENNNSVLKIFNDSLNQNKKIEETINISKDDYQFEGKIIITPFTSWLGYTYAYLVEISDYTEPLLTDRGKVWGATLQRIAHEIKTPISTLILSLDNLRYRLGHKSVEVNKEIIRMQGELERIKNLTKNFLLFSNMEKMKPTQILLDDVVYITLKKFDSYINKGIKVNYNKNNYKILADFNQILQFLPLIIENSIDSCKGVGEITIDTQEVILEEKNFIKLIISDTGEGISQEIIDKIFEPYFTTKKDGTGMGLTLAKKIIDDNKGKLEIKSITPKGTDVIIYLPKS